MIRVFIVEDETLLRAGLRELLTLDPSLTVVGDASSGEQAVAQIPLVHPDLILMDVRMPGWNGPETTRQLKARNCPAKILLITTFDDDEALLDGLRAGANGFLRKDVSLKQLREAIDEIMAGKTVLRPAVSPQGVERFQKFRPQFPSSDVVEPLTAREHEVLQYIAAGMSNREISELLGTSEGTIKTHASTILGKLGVRDRTRAVLKALDLGLL